ncbi:MAG TPA: hypothetical protein VHB48_09845, partial [Chitinophagaceae bacterium]|nr:hypothetical protein [Chitinophagaceae bacterium]
MCFLINNPLKPLMMNMNDILQADVLDIIFDGRNKQYGAYQLRKSYNRRLVIAMAAMLFICLLVMAGSVLAKNVNSKKAQVITVEDYNLTAVDVVPPLPPPPPPPRPQPRV